MPHPGSFTPGKESQYPLYGCLSGPQGWSGRVQKIPLTPRFDPRTVQPVASPYTDCAITAHIDRRTTEYQGFVRKMPKETPDKVGSAHTAR
jgi:hypothetical protein